MEMDFTVITRNVRSTLNCCIFHCRLNRERRGNLDETTQKSRNSTWVA
jgi:hypothetical protein